MAVDQGVTAESPTATNDVVDLDTAPAANPSTDVTAAPSPAKDESVLDRVNAALKPKTEASSASENSQDAKPDPNAAPESEEKEPEGDPTEEELARYHSRTRRRLQKLMTERNEARDESEKLKPDAEVGRRITSFLSDSGINSQEANLLLDIGRNLKRDPLKALEQLKPFYEQLSRMAGEVLPADLQEAVGKGEISEAYARQLARGRTETAVLSQRTQVNDQRQQEQQARQQTEAHAASVGQAISTWEANQAKSDPDWSLKQDRLGELIELEVRRSGYPKTTAAAVELAEKMKAKVNAELARFAPRKTAVNPVNPASSVRPTAAAPKTALEAVQQRLTQMAA
jgi:hypothetical protein